MTINLIKPSLTLLAEYVSCNEYVKFFDGGLVHTFFDDELDIVQQSQDFFDFVASVAKTTLMYFATSAIMLSTIGMS